MTPIQIVYTTVHADDNDIKAKKHKILIVQVISKILLVILMPEELKLCLKHLIVKNVGITRYI